MKRKNGILFISILILSLCISTLGVKNAGAYIVGNHQSTNPSSPFMMLVDQCYQDDDYIYNAYESFYYRIPLVTNQDYFFFFRGGNTAGLDWGAGYNWNVTIIGSSGFPSVIDHETVIESGVYWLLIDQTGYYNITISHQTSSTGWTGPVYIGVFTIPTATMTATEGSQVTCAGSSSGIGFSAIKINFDDSTGTYYQDQPLDGYELYYRSEAGIVYPSSRYSILSKTSGTNLGTSSSHFSVYNASDFTYSRTFYQFSDGSFKISKYTAPSTPAVPGYSALGLFSGVVIVLVPLTMKVSRRRR